MQAATRMSYLFLSLTVLLEPKWFGYGMDWVTATDKAAYNQIGPLQLHNCQKVKLLG